LLYTHTDWLQTLLSRLAPFYPYAVFGAGVLLGWRFHRSRLAVRPAAVHARGPHAAAFAWAKGWRGTRLCSRRSACCAAQPAALALTAERGVLTPPGLARLRSSWDSLALVAILDREAAGAAAALLHTRLLPQWCSRGARSPTPPCWRSSWPAG